MSLKTDYQDAELSPSMGGKRRYNQIENADGTFSLEDRTAYTRLGDNFGAEDINATNREVNELNDSLNEMNQLITSAERKIGTIDGVDLYEKRYSLSGSYGDGFITIDSTILNSYNIVEIGGTAKKNDGMWIPFPLYISSATFFYPFIDSNGLRMYNLKNPIVKLNMYIKYTKS